MLYPPGGLIFHSLGILAAAWRQCWWQRRHSGGSDGTVGGNLAALAGDMAALWRHNCHSAALGGMAAQFGGTGGTLAAQSGGTAALLAALAAQIGGTAALAALAAHWRHSEPWSMRRGGGLGPSSCF